MGATMLALALAACGAPFVGPHAPGRACDPISAADFDAALAAGAARGDATIDANGTINLVNGPGVQHCATYSSTLKPCRRPNDYVIRYTLADGGLHHVRVPAGAQYRFRVAARPTPCEIVGETPAGQ